jgi:hypothetical protein
MMKFILAFALLLTPLAAAQEQPQKIGRYQIVTAPTPPHSIFRIDTITGEISYCYPISTPSSGSQAAAVVCVREIQVK